MNKQIQILKGEQIIIKGNDNKVYEVTETVSPVDVLSKGSPQFDFLARSLDTKVNKEDMFQQLRLVDEGLIWERLVR